VRLARPVQLVLDREVATVRLVLRPFREDDLDEVHALRSDPEVRRFVPWPAGTVQDTLVWLRARIAADRLAADGDAAAWAVVRQEDGRLIGTVNAWWRSVEHRQGELGFAFASGVQRRGYGREASAALLDLLFSELDLHRVCGRTDPRNTASAALMRRLGMRQEGHLREVERHDGEWLDVLVFALLRQEWQAATARAAAR
jgi:RimJ/RimL family protein N-acetyltransferase